MRPDLPAPRPGADVQACFLTDGCVLFSESRQEIHALNTSAGVIWCLLEEGLDAACIAGVLQRDFRLAAADATAFVGAALADWERRGLLAGAGAEAPEPMAPAPPVRTGPVPPAMAERCYALLGRRFLVGFAQPAQAVAADAALAHLAGPGREADVVLQVFEEQDDILLTHAGEVLGRCRSVGELAPLLKEQIWIMATNAHDFFLGIHAGVVGGPSGTLLMPGDPGSGKSTLTAALVHAGFRYFSDEMALLRDDLRVMPLPLSLCIKSTGLAVLASRFPELQHLPVHDRADGKRVAYLPPPGTPMVSDAAAPVRAILFPRYREGAPTRCRSLTKAAALQRLMAQCLVVRGRLTLARVQALVGWIETMPCHELESGSLAEAVDVAARLLAGTPVD